MSKIDRPWTMGAARYQALIGVDQPHIAEISPFQYGQLSRRQREAYDKKRHAAWNASSAAKREWRAAVESAWRRGAFTLDDPDLHSEAKSAVMAIKIADREAEIGRQYAELADANALTIADLEVGMRIFHPVYQYGEVTKVNRKSFYAIFSSGRSLKVGITDGLSRLSRGDMMKLLSTNARLERQGLTHRVADDLTRLRHDIIDAAGEVLLERATLEEINQWLAEREHGAAS